MSDGREGDAAEDTHSNGAGQVAGLPAVAVPQVQGVQGLEVIGVSLQVHLAQEFVLQDSVVPDLGGDSGSLGGGGHLQEQEHRSGRTPSGASGFLPSVQLPPTYTVQCVISSAADVR